MEVPAGLVTLTERICKEGVAAMDRDENTLAGRPRASLGDPGGNQLNHKRSFFYCRREELPH